MKSFQGSDAITVEGLRKRFGNVDALSNISLEVHRGELFGLLGPNGAGKTTTINLLIGLARPDAGTTRVGGIDCTRDPRAAHHLIGVVPDESNLYPELTGFENLCFCGALFGMLKRARQRRARALLDMFDLAGAADRLFAGYSRGMKRKLTIAAGIIHQPQILFLDEPTTGLDVLSARQLRALIGELSASGTTIFLTTHNIEEAERLCDRVAFIVSGRIVRIDTVENLVQPVRGRHVVQIVCANALEDVLGKLTRAFPSLAFSAPGEGLIRVEADVPVHVGPLVRFLEEHGLEVEEARRIRPSLEDVFVETTGIGAAVMRHEKESAEGGQ